MEYPKVNGTGRSEKQENTGNSTTTLLKQLTENLPEELRGNGSPAGEIRRTSDLFDMLQQALSAPPSTGLSRPREAPRRLIHIEIEGAENIPKFPGRINKKLRKKHKNHIRATVQEAPNTFVTFEAFPVADETSVVKIYSTGVIEKNCSPAWHSNFSIFVSADAQNLPLRVWRRSTNQSDDVLIGIASLTLLPNVSEKCDIVDASGQNAGKLKVRVFPAPEVMTTPSEDALLSDLGPALTNLVFPLSGDHELGNVSFSRALKRKFTELEEISQRLRARLHDVTGDANDDPDDEFEHDLNTHADEEEGVQPGGSSGAYAWLGLNEEEKRKFIHTEVTKELFVDVDGGNQSIDLTHIEAALEQTAITDEDKLNGVNSQLDDKE